MRAIGLVIAVALAGVAAWLIVTGAESPRRVQLGVLAGLWGALLGAFTLFGARRHVQVVEPEDGPPSSTELELRSVRNELERAEEAAARRMHEARLEHILRDEVHAAIGREVAALRAEIADLRSELLEKVGGQLRLERIETTRVIGSDLEALHHEVRQLQAVARDVGDVGAVRSQPAESAPGRPIVEPARVRPLSREAAEVQAEVQPARAPAERAPQPAAPAPAETTGPIRLEPPPRPAPGADLRDPRPAPSPASEREQVTLPLASTPRLDDLAALPRIEPFTDFELDPVDVPGEGESAYTGRRRRGDDDDPESGRHASAEDPDRPHHRAADEGDDLLARLLAREGISR